MKIQVLSVEVKTVPTAKGSYQMADIAFKNLTFQGKVEGKKLMSFGAGADTFKTLSIAQSGSVFEISVVKNDKGFNDWTSATSATDAPEQAPAASTGVYQPKAGPSNSTPVRSSYETPEERSAKQVYIIRQSSLSNAIATLSAGSKAAVKPAEAIAVAKQYTDFVLGVLAVSNDFLDLPNDDVDVM